MGYISKVCDRFEAKDLGGESPGMYCSRRNARIQFLEEQLQHLKLFLSDTQGSKPFWKNIKK